MQLFVRAQQQHVVDCEDNETVRSLKVINSKNNFNLDKKYLTQLKLFSLNQNSENLHEKTRIRSEGVCLLRNN